MIGFFLIFELYGLSFLRWKYDFYIFNDIYFRMTPIFKALSFNTLSTILVDGSPRVKTIKLADD